MANLAAIRTLSTLEHDRRPASAAEQRVLARWSGWGAVPQIFDDRRDEWRAEREQLRSLLDDDAYAAARRTTINAHYTDAAYVSSIWRALERLGFDGGRVLEPGCGSGTFIGMAPDRARMTGVELDPTTARIARALYPGAEIRAESFADTRFPGGHFDAVIGNVPFADVRLHDTRHNRGNHSIHNHFIIKSLELTRPGGVVAVLTSHYTLDAQNPAARREMNELADLLGAVRLPTGAHARAAGTDVVTDLLLFRRREPGREPASRTWEMTSSVQLGDQTARLNNYFPEHPQQVLGELSVGNGMYSGSTLMVRGDVGRLDDALAAVIESARDRGLTFMPGSAEIAVAPATQPGPATPGLIDGHLEARADGRFTVVAEGKRVPLPVPRSQSAELDALLRMRDTAAALLAAEAKSWEDTPEIEAMRRKLRMSYSSYSSYYGPINRFSLRASGQHDPETGEPRYARVPHPVIEKLRSDPRAPLVMALEVFDEATQTAKPATLLSHRVIDLRAPVRGVETAADALAVCLDTRGRPDLAAIAELLGQTPAEAREALGDLVFDDPAMGRLVTAPEYLSGNVREKLDAARAAATGNRALAVNVAKLEAVLPAELGMHEIEARLAAAWISTDVHRQFLVELLDDPYLRLEHPGGSIWELEGSSSSVLAVSKWGTERMSATAIVRAMLEQREIRVTDEIEKNKRVLNPVETTAAQEKAEAIQERFAAWVWEEPERAEKLVAEYNRRFNSLVLRDYAAEGQRLTLPGLAANFRPRPHQLGAVARMISEPAVGLFHEVGAGKTAEMVMGVMELQRLGMVSKPAVVVPNHMLEQFSREWMQLYPQARILAASSEDLAGDKRRAFVAKAATNDWDAVIMTRTAFERLPMSVEAQKAYVGRELADLRRLLENQKGSGDRRTVKRVEKLMLAAEERLEAKLDSLKDPGIAFEETGIDYLVVDEIHDFKNLRTVSNIQDAAIEGSQRASDLHMKVEFLRERHGHRVITGATATPIANSITEAHVILRYFRLDLLQAAGVEDFDVWAATFGRTVSELEMAPEGGGNYRQKTRFARFQNVPEMLRMWAVCGDVKTAEDLGLPTPLLAIREDGQRTPEIIVVEPSPELIDYVTTLGERAEKVRSGKPLDPKDNMLSISSDGRMAALDPRMVGLPSSTTPGKIEVAAERIVAIWQEHRDRTYLDPLSGDPSPTPGALQIVFCDLGTPSEKWNAYNELREQLVGRGMPRGQIRFIHEAKNDRDKARLFAAARSGKIAVLVGSTQKMGVGTNVQARAVALHHLDCPWRPADIEQREGRILRQGNQNAEVRILRYVVERSFDAYMWQTVERKWKFITQMMRGRLDVREIEDIGDGALSAAEIKALASGDPLLLEKAHADFELAKLERLSRAFGLNQHLLLRRVRQEEEVIRAADEHLPQIRKAIERSRDTRGDRFQMTVSGRVATTRNDAAALISNWAEAQAGAHKEIGRLELGEVGELGGLPVDAAGERDLSKAWAVLSFRDVPLDPVVLSLDEPGSAGIGTIRRLENRLASMPQLERTLEQSRASAAAQLEEAREELGRPFRQQDALAAARARVAESHAKLERTAAPPGLRPPDPAGLRRVLGERYWHEIVARADALADATLSVEEQRNGARDALAKLDPPAAYEVQRIVHERTKREQLASDSGAAAKQHDATAASAGGREVRDRIDAAAVQHDTAQAHHHRLAALDDREQQLRERGTHPALWMEEHREQLAHWLAAEARARHLAVGEWVDVAAEPAVAAELEVTAAPEVAAAPELAA